MKKILIAIVILLILPCVVLASSSSFYVFSNTSAYGYVEKRTSSYSWSGPWVDNSSFTYRSLDLMGGGFPLGADSSSSPDYYLCGRSFLKFDTSALPDNATVTSATLYLYASSSAGTNITLYGDYANSATSPTFSDWVKPLNGSAFSNQTINIGGIVTSITLSNPNNISKTGNTIFMMGFSDTSPTTNQIKYIKAQYTDSYTYQLNVTYTVGFQKLMFGLTPTAIYGSSNVQYVLGTIQ